MSAVQRFIYDKWLFVPSVHRTPLKWSIANRAMMGAVLSLSKVWIHLLNKTKVHNQQTLTDVVLSRSADRGLITISNHVSCIDDPLMWGIVKMRCLTKESSLRWIPVAEDICYTNYLHAWFFSICKSVPVQRGSGVYQKSMDFLLDKINKGQWVHIFPEGKVNLSDDKLLRFKWGVGRLIEESKTSPIVLPIVHVGMDDILPNRRPHIPLIGKNLTLMIGSPMDFAEDVECMKALKKSPRDIRKHITDKLQAEVRILLDKAQNCGR